MEKKKVNWDKVLQNQLNDFNGKPSLLLHSCCAPCSSYVLEYLNEKCEIKIFYYNPNILPENEYQKRLSEQIRLADKQGIEVICGEYEPEKFRNYIRGFENEPEGGARCELCFKMRMEETAKTAKTAGLDFFTTTLTISPHKNADKINAIMEQVGNVYDMPVLFSDFKKRSGYQRSIELSREFCLYRQNYCGCIPIAEIGTVP